MSGNYSDEDLLVIDGLAYDTAFSYQDFNGDLIQFFGSNPSGHPLTVIINGLVNSLYMRYAYYHANPKKEVHSFKDNVALITYGDDNVMNVAKNIDWFNHTVIQEQLKKIGVMYTMAEKDQESIPFIDIKDVSFLKRQFRYHEDLKCMVSPLDEDSIARSLLKCVRSKSITLEEQMVQSMDTQVGEYFFYGREKFHEKRALFLDIIKEYNLELYVKDSMFASYEDYIERFKTASKNIKLLYS
jgi:hypothetical protein